MCGGTRGAALAAQVLRIFSGIADEKGRLFEVRQQRRRGYYRSRGYSMVLVFSCDANTPNPMRLCSQLAARSCDVQCSRDLQRATHN